jgi:nickel-dependent lactate racemase
MPSAEIEAAISSSVELEALARRLKEGGKNVAIAVDDLTRPTPAWQLLPPLLSRLEQSGLDLAQLQIVMALGTHRVLVLDDLVKKLGKGAASDLCVLNHSPFTNLVGLGRSPYGLSVEVNRTFAEADVKIGIGCILPHGHAGFSGGAKIVLPGLSAIDTIQGFHQMRPLRKDVPAGETSVVDRDRIQLEMHRFVETVGLDLVINVVINSKRDIAGLYIGDPVGAYLKGVDVARQVYATDLPEGVDVAVLNAYPKDTEFYQVLNAMHIVRTTRRVLVRQGGAIVLTTAASEGMGFHYLFGPQGRRPFKFDPAMIGERRLFLYSPSVTGSQVQPVFSTGAESFRDWDLLLDRLQTLYGSSCKVAVLPCASIQTDSALVES